MLIYVKLLLAHILCDFLFQPNSWVQHKKEKKWTSVFFYYHIGLHFILSSLMVWDLNKIPLILCIALSHSMIDLTKLNFEQPKYKNYWFIGDQLAHLLCIYVFTTLYLHQDLNIGEIWTSTPFWIYVSAISTLTFVVSVMMKVILSQWTEKLGPQNEHLESLKNAGKYIGMLERLLIFLFIILNHWEAVGLLLTAKSIFRFSSIKESKDLQMAEYILIGTLISFSTAIGTALITLQFTTQIIQ